MSQGLAGGLSELFGNKGQEGSHFCTSGEEESLLGPSLSPAAAELTHQLQLSLSPQGWG